MNYMLLVLGALIAAANVKEPQGGFNVTEWEEYKQLYGKSYENAEVDSMRHTIFRYNKQRLEQFQAQQDETTKTFSVKLNHLSDLSDLEMKRMKGFRLSEGNRKLEESPQNQAFLDAILDDDSAGPVPDNFDWRKVPGRVTEVKNQGGSCGSCWAFSTTGLLEGQEMVRRQYNLTLLKELSEQNLVDCVKDNDCSGGSMEDALNYIKTTRGIDDEASYPYEGVNGNCRYRKDHAVIGDSGSVYLPEGDEEKLKEIVYKYGPVSVAIDASDICFRYYSSGIYENEWCKNSANLLDHAVLVVGYGVNEEKVPYWIVKNSWSSLWGDKGYVYMRRNNENMCGIATAATIATF